MSIIRMKLLTICRRRFVTHGLWTMKSVAILSNIQKKKSKTSTCLLNPLWRVGTETKAKLFVCWETNIFCLISVTPRNTQSTHGI